MCYSASMTAKPEENGVSTTTVWEWFASQRYRFLLASAGLLFVWLGLTRYLGAGTDDVFITLWAGESLAAGHGLVNHNFEPLEVSSSLLHTLIVAVLAKLAPDSVYTLNKLTGLAAGLLTLGAVCFYRTTLFPRKHLRFPAVGLSLIALATMPSFLYWTLGGLETPFVALLLLLCAVYFARYMLRPTWSHETLLILCQILLMAARPEAVYLIPFSVIFAGVCGWCVGWRVGLARIILAPSAFFFALGFLRKAYFGTFFPNTVYAKMGAIADKFPPGLFYVRQFYESGYFVLFLGLALITAAVYYGFLLACCLRRRNALTSAPEGPLVFVLGLIVTVHVFVILSGGDWMEHFRFLCPAIPLMIVLATSFLFAVVGGLIERMKRAGFSRFTVRLFAVFAACLIVPLWAASPFQRGDVTIGQGAFPATIKDASSRISIRELLAGEGSLDQRVKMLNARYNRDIHTLSRFVNSELPDLDARSDGLVIATIQMGLFPYLVRKQYPDPDVYFIDTWGLCTQEIALMGLPGGFFGVWAGGALPRVMAGEAGVLSEFVLSKKPNLVYDVNGTDAALLQYAALGYQVVLRCPSALIVFNPDAGGSAPRGQLNHLPAAR